MILSQYLKKLFSSSQSAGILLILCVVLSLIIANSPLAEGLSTLLNTEIGIESLHLKYSFSSWINDGLMTIFFLLVGLEIKREIIGGELSDIKKASLPIFAAVGGMAIPALIYFGITYQTDYQSGWGIPMATDIAFSLAILSLLGKKVPTALKVFLAALAIVDDLGAILVIAIFYTNEINWLYLAVCAGIIALLFLFNRLKITKLVFYIIPGILLWYFMHHSGIHATIAGVILAFCIPINNEKTNISPLEKLEHNLHIPVSFIIMPIFAFANTNIHINPEIFSTLINPLSLGIFGGLVIGKVIGINLLSYIAIKLKISTLPENSQWSQIIGVGFLAGIGFTMSIFISLLSFPNQIDIQDEAKISILLASLVSGALGYSILHLTSKKNNSII
ncbi:Na+/H+ antiporter NhaA [Chryseobacterium sp. T1]